MTGPGKAAASPAHIAAMAVRARLAAVRRRRRAVKRGAAYVLAGLVALALATCGLVPLVGGAAGRDGIPSTGGQQLSIPCIEDVPYFSQKDPAWAAETLGSSDATMGAAGCTVCCIAMGASAVGESMDPGEVRAALARIDGFTDSGFVVWDAVERATEGAVRVELARLSHAAIDAELSQGRPVIANILLSETFPHSVLIVGKDGQEYLVMDPLGRDREILRLSERAAAIRSVRVFRGR